MNSIAQTRLSQVKRLVARIALSALFAWLIASSAVTSGAWLAHLNSQPSGGLAEGILRAVLTILWLPARLSDRLFELASSPFHSPEDVVANVVAYVYETFLTVFILSFIGLWARSALVGLQGRPASRTKSTGR